MLKLQQHTVPAFQNQTVHYLADFDILCERYEINATAENATGIRRSTTSQKVSFKNILLVYNFDNDNMHSNQTN